MLRSFSRRVVTPSRSPWLPTARSYTTVQRRCPSCSAPLPTPLPACTQCWHISPLPPKTTPHQIFDLPAQPNPFVVNLPILRARFRDAQALCHPDSWTSRGPHKQDIAQNLSSHINDAYQRLLKPLPRAEYILELNDHPITENDQLIDVEFILDIMQAREAIEESENKDDVLALAEDNRAKIEQTLEMLESLIAEQNWPEVKTAVIRLRYLEGIERAAKEFLDNA